MKNKFPMFLFVILNLFQSVCFAQNKKMDSLKVELKNAKQDTTRLNIYKEICNNADETEQSKYITEYQSLADKLLAIAKDEKERKNIIVHKIYSYDLEGRLYSNSDFEKGISFWQKALNLSYEIKDTARINTYLLGLSTSYKTIGNLPKALEFAQKGLEVAEKGNYYFGISNSLFKIGNLYRSQKDYEQALASFEKGLDLFDKHKTTDYWEIAKVLFAVGGLYSETHNTSKSLEYYQKALDLFSKNNDKAGTWTTIGFIGNMYKNNTDYTNALLYYNKALSTGLEFKNDNVIATVYNSIGNVYVDKGEFEKAIDYHLKALEIAEKQKKDNYISDTYFYLTQDYMKQKNYQKSKEYLEHCFKLKNYYGAITCGTLEQLAYQIDSATGNTKGAFEHYKEFINYRNKLKSDDIIKAAQQEKFNTEYEKQKAIDKKEQEKKDALTKAESKKQKLIIIFVCLGLLSVLVFAGFVFRSLRIRNKQNKIIVEQKTVVEEKQREILDSIEYALRIQTAILPPARIVKQYLENSFILYKPKDIVAGDFYWMEQVGISDSKFQISNSVRPSEISNLKSEIILFAACDCTGHGVPGAMVSVVCHNALNRAVREFGLTKPSEILDKTAEIVIENFSKSEESIKDGMDISLASLNLQTMELQWAGANNPLWIVRAGHPELVEGVREDKMLRQAQHDSPQNFNLSETRADKQPIGMNEDSKPFTNHTFTLNSGDTIYLFTDGFADQFGGDNGQKKLTRKYFKELILSMQDKPMQEQGVALDKFITEYRKEVEQIDDILVMGVRV